MKDFIKQKLREDLEYHHASDATKDEYVIGEDNLRFNNGRLNKTGPNTIFKDDEPIVDFGIGEIGTVNLNGEVIPNALYLKGGYNAAKQGVGYGKLGIKFIFSKLPKIQNIIIQCFDTACPFWFKIGGEELSSKKMPGGNLLRNLVITRDSLN